MAREADQQRNFQLPEERYVARPPRNMSRLPEPGLFICRRRHRHVAPPAFGSIPEPTRKVSDTLERRVPPATLKFALLLCVPPC